MREHGWHPPKSLDLDENFKPEHTLFCCELRFVAIYVLFRRLWAKKCFCGSKAEFLGKKYTRVAEVAREHRWHPPKSLVSDENFKPEHTLF